MLIRSLRYYYDRSGKQNTELKKELNYFRNHRDRMNYKRHRDQKLPIGNGVTESACRTLVGIRMKRSGQRWGVEGGKASLAFRALVTSGRFDTAWRALKRHIKNPLAANDNRWTDLMKQAD